MTVCKGTKGRDGSLSAIREFCFFCEGFEYFIESSKSKNIDQNNTNILLELLAIDIFKREQNFEITLLFSKNRFITLSSEVIEVTLEDQKLEND